MSLILICAIVGILSLVFFVITKGFGRIKENQVGLIYKTIGKSLPPGHRIATKGEVGYQACVLATGWYIKFPWIYRIDKTAAISIGVGEIGLVEAKDGIALSTGQVFGRYVDCNYFQDGDAFLRNNGQRGKQLSILKDGTYQINTELFDVRIAPAIHVPPGEIALVVAIDGETPPISRVLGKAVPCKDFEDAEEFIANGGQMGRQIAILRSGTYYINTDLFTVITSENAELHGMKSEDLYIYEVKQDMVGIVTTLDGDPLLTGDIAGSVVDGHDKFQDGQRFIDAGGRRGLQEEVLQEGSWNLNPWFVSVTQIPLTEIPTGTVGVIVSNIGKTAIHAGHELVEEGYKGVWKVPLSAGKYPINTRAMDVVIVPTHDITLNWSDRVTKKPTNYDYDLHPLKLSSNDGFTFNVEVTQVIRISPENAPKMISRIASEESTAFESIKHKDNIEDEKYQSIRNVITRVLEPMVGNYLRSSAQENQALNFLKNRLEIQVDAAESIEQHVRKYGIDAVTTLIGEITGLEVLEKELKAQTTYVQEQKTEEEHRKIIIQKEETNYLKEEAITKQRLEISRREANEERERQDVALNRLREEHKIDLEAFRERVKILSPEIYAQIETEKAWAEAVSEMEMRAPDFLSIGGSGGSGGDPMHANYQLMQLQLLRDINKDRRTDRELASPEQRGQIEQSKDPIRFISQNDEIRCPIILMLDTSSNMSSLISRVQEGFATFKKEIERDFTAFRRLEVAIITFNDRANLLQDFAPLNQQNPPRLTTQGQNMMGQGLDLMLSELDILMSKPGYDESIYHTPWVFLIIGSQPTGEWELVAQRVQQAVEDNKLNFFIVGVQDVDLMTLRQLSHPSRTPVMLEGLRFQEMFHWLADSMKQVSRSEPGSNVELSPITGWAHT